MTTETILDLNALLDENMDAVENVADFVTPPAGTYMLTTPKVELVSVPAMEAKDGKAATAASVRIVVTLAVAETIETDAMPVADGSMFSERFQYTEDGLKYFKRFAKNVLNTEDIDGVSLRDVFATMEANPPFKAVLTLVQSKPDKSGKVYENVRIRPVFEKA